VNRPWALVVLIAAGLGPGLVPAGAAATASAAEPAATTAPGAAAVLRVGVVEGAAPCSVRRDGVWQGLAPELWNRVASRETLAFRLSGWPSTNELLEATRTGRVDVAVGCINVSPERLLRYRFSLPFQEDGLAVLVMRTPLDLGRAFLGALIGPGLLQLLGGFLLAIALLTALTWRVEHYGEHPETRRLGRLRSCGKLFQVLATGPGGNTIVVTNRGNAIVIAAYLVRIVAASLLVGFLTVRVVDETQGRARGRIGDLTDLEGLRVAVRRGSISESLIRELNREAPPERAIRPVPIGSIDEALPLLDQARADAVLGDELQLAWLERTGRSRGRLPLLALRGIRPESQAFAFAPALPQPTAERIDQAISSLKRSGVVGELRAAAVQPPGTGTPGEGEQR
jgi:ABC-type amino acid transport substrate-binding protein